MAILRRLLWKEWRLGWPMLALGLLLPPLAMAMTVKQEHPRSPEWTTVALFLLMTAVAVWAATFAGRERLRRSYAGGHFSLNPAWSTLTTYLVQGLFALLIGLNVGWCRTQLGDGFPLWIALLLGAGYLGSQFALSFVTAQALSPTAGIVAGICWMLGHSEVMNLLTTLSTRQEISFYQKTTILNINQLLYLAAGVVAALLVLVALLLPARQLSLPRRILACVILGLGTIAVPVSPGLLELWLEYRHPVYYALPQRLPSADGSLAIEVLERMSDNERAPTRAALRFIDYREYRQIDREFTNAVRPIGFVGRRAAILAQQRPGEREITLLRWDFNSNDIDRVLTLPARRGVLDEIVLPDDWNLLSFFAELSPDNRYGIFAIPSLYSSEIDARDLWLVDFQQKQRVLIRPTMLLYAPKAHLSWLHDEAILSYENRPLRISLTTGKASRPPLAAPTEEGR